jgi:hypothetical protein
MSAQGESFKQAAQSLAVDESQENPLDERLQLASLSQAAFGFATGPLSLLHATSEPTATTTRRWARAGCISEMIPGAAGRSPP